MKKYGMQYLSFPVGLTDYSLESLKKRISEKLKNGYRQVGPIKETVMNVYGDKRYGVMLVKDNGAGRAVEV